MGRRKKIARHLAVVGFARIPGHETRTEAFCTMAFQGRRITQRRPWKASVRLWTRRDYETTT